MEEKKEDFVKELTNLINRYSLENASNTPDFMLSEFLWSCLQAFNRVMIQRKIWYSNRTDDAKEILRGIDNISTEEGGKNTMKLSRVEVKELKGGITGCVDRKFEPGQLIIYNKKSFLSCPMCGETIALDSHKVTLIRPAGKPCSHPGCASHLVYPCEGCRKAWGLKASIEPSIRHESCHLHIYIRDNRITYLSDI